MSSTVPHTRHRRSAAPASAILAALVMALVGCDGETTADDGPLTNADMTEILDMWKENACAGFDRDRYAAVEIDDNAAARASCTREDISGGGLQAQLQIVSIYGSVTGIEAFVADRDCSQQFTIHSDRWVATTQAEDVADRLVAAGGTFCEG